MGIKASSFLLFAVLSARPARAQLPTEYFRLLTAGATQVEKRLEGHRRAEERQVCATQPTKLIGVTR